MKKYFSILIGIACLHTASARDLSTECQTPEIVSANCLPMQAKAFLYESQSLAEGNWVCKVSIAGVHVNWKNTAFHLKTSHTAIG